MCVITELINAIPIPTQDNPHFGAVAILVIAIAGIPAAVIPLTDQIPALIIGVVDHQAVGQALLQKLAVFIIDPMKLLPIPVLLPNHILVFIKANIFGAPVRVDSPLYQAVLIVVEEGPVILPNGLEYSGPVTVVIEYDKFLSRGQELARYPA